MQPSRDHALRNPSHDTRQDSVARPRRVRVLAAAAILGLMAVPIVGCSNDRTDAQPGPDVSGFVAGGGFDDLPRVSGSKEIGRTSHDGDVTTQSFSAEGVTPELVMSFYEDELVDWSSPGVEDAGEALRQEFRSPSGERLEVSATVLSRGGSDRTQTVQYSLVYHS